MDNERKTESRRKRGEHHTNVWLFTLEIGFFAGLIWGIVRWICYELQFTRVLPGVLAEPFFRTAFLRTGWGIVVGIASFIVFSIIATALYMVLLRRVRGPWAGFAYGLFWWAVIYVVVGPMLTIVEPVNLIGWDSLITEICVFLLWGLFIGYSIAFEFTDEASREPAHAHKPRRRIGQA